MSPAIRISYASRKAVWITKFMARIVAAVASLGLLAFVTQHITSLRFDHHKYNTSDYMQAVIAEVLAVFSTIFNLAEVICLLSFKGHRGITPADLAAGDLFFSIVLFMANLLRNTCTSEWCKPSTEYDGDPRASGAAFDVRGVPFWFGTVLTVLHFVLFISGTAEAIVRRSNTMRVVIDRRDEEAEALAKQIHKALLERSSMSNNKEWASDERVPLSAQEMPQEEGIKEKRSSVVS